MLKPKLLILALALSCFSFTQAKRFDHSYSAWDRILKAHVTKGSHYNKFNYKALNKNINEVKKYANILSSVTKAEYQGFSRDQKLAFLINAYNVFTVELIARKYPIKSILSLGVLGTGPWDKKNIPFLESEFSLNMIEKKYIIPKFGEARIHFAINCASIGCPSLQNFAFTANGLEQQLEEATKSFVASEHRYSYDSDKNKLKISKIFNWYENDFIKQYGSVQNLFAKVLKNRKIEKAKVGYRKYNWNLNE